jgi:hypothetical protein
MRRAFALLVLVAAATVSNASAASMRVDAGILQAWSFDVDLCAEQPDICVPLVDPDDVYELELEVSTPDEVDTSSNGAELEHDGSGNEGHDDPDDEPSGAE